MNKSIFISLLSLTVATGCSTIIEGQSQEISVNTNPPGAACDLIRDDKVIARVDPTPGSANVEKTKNDIKVVCNKTGYKTATAQSNSDVAAATFGNALLGGVVGVGVDMATGASNKYDSPVDITLSKK